MFGNSTGKDRRVIGGTGSPHQLLGDNSIFFGSEN